MTAAHLSAILDGLADATPPRLPHKSPGSIGIVTAGGGLDLTVNAWLLCARLRALGCRLPVEVIHARSEVIPARVREAFPDKVTFRALDAAPPGYSIKPMALWTSPFDLCLWIDADNLPLRDPAFLLSMRVRAHFWPDAFRTSSADVAAAAQPLGPLEFESGQMVVPTRACARALWFARELNERYRAVLYSHVYGDKDTWRLAWALAGEQADVVSRLPLVVGHECTFVDLRPFVPMSLQLRLPGARPLDVGLVQHGPDGPPLFLHRTVREWHLFDLRDTLSWAQALEQQVAIARVAWRPDAPGSVPDVVSDAYGWAHTRLGEIEWFARAFGAGLPARLWLKHRFAVEAALASGLRVFIPGRGRRSTPPGAHRCEPSPDRVAGPPRR